LKNKAKKIKKILNFHVFQICFLATKSFFNKKGRQLAKTRKKHYFLTNKLKYKCLHPYFFFCGNFEFCGNLGEFLADLGEFLASETGKMQFLTGNLQLFCFFAFLLFCFLNLH